jgi:hypothetical protein
MPFGVNTTFSAEITPMQGSWELADSVTLNTAAGLEAQDMKYADKREVKPLECDSQVSVHLLPPDLEVSDQHGDQTLSKSAIWVGEEDFYGGVVRSTEPEKPSEEGSGSSDTEDGSGASDMAAKVLKVAKCMRSKDPNYKLPKELAEQLDAHVILGFDTEFKSPPRQTPQEIREGKRSGGVKNAVLSYQF